MSVVEWRQSTWGEEISLEYGKAIRGYKDVVAPYRVYGTNGPVGWTEAPLAPGPGVILGRKGAYRGVHFSPDPFFVIDTAYYVKPKSAELDMRWLFYAIIHHKLGEIDDGSPIPSTTRAAVYVRDVEIPPEPEQRAIASVLSVLDDKIELNRRMNETLERQARSIFRDWFVDFGPTRAKMAGEKPYHTPEIWNLFPDRLNDDGIPEGWEERTINDDFDVIMGQSPPGSTYNEESIGLPFFQGRRDFDFRFPNRRVYCSKPTRISRKDWTLLSVRAPVGDINRAWEECCIGRGVAAFMHRRCLASFTYYVGLNLREELTSYDKDGTVFGSINQKQFKGLKVLASNDNISKAFDSLVAPIDERIRNNTAESLTLAKIRDLLLPKLMSGEIRVRDAEKHIGEAG